MGEYNFGNLVGNVGSIAMLQHSIQAGTLPNFVILCGIRGTGKTSSAQIAAMALTCLNPVNGNPCCQCERCRQNEAALKTGQETPYVKKVNLAGIANKEDVQELIKKIFVFSSLQDNVAFVLEEAHALRNDAQTCLLTEIDNIPANVFVFMTTTKANGIIPDLRSRALIFQYNRVADKDMKALLSAVIRLKGWKNLNAAVAQMLVKKAKGIPRELLRLASFVGATPASTEEIMAFLNAADTNDCISLFATFAADSVEGYRAIDSILEKVSTEVLIEELKEFVLSAIFVMGGAAHDFNREQAGQIRDVFAGVNMQGVVAVLERLNYQSSEADLRFALLKIKQLLNRRTLSSVLESNSIDAKKQQKAAEVLAGDRADLEGLSVSSQPFKGLSLQELRAFEKK